MPYLVGDHLPTERPGARLRELLAQPGIIRMPGAHNGIAALQVKRAGFSAAYLSGAAMSASMGLPDLGIITIDDVAFFIRQVARAGLPVLVDGDTGYGEALNVMQMIRTFEAAGAAAVHIEDQFLPKKCGHLNDKRIVTPEDMALKVAAARKASTDIVIVARTDAAASEGVAGAIKRAELYLQAGAEVIFPEALTTPDQFREVAAALPGVPLLANMTEFGRTPYLTADEFEELGYKIVIWPVSSLRVANRAQSELYATLAAVGSAEAVLERMQTRQELYDAIDLAGYEELDAAIVKTVLPD